MRCRHVLFLVGLLLALSCRLLFVERICWLRSLPRGQICGVDWIDFLHHVLSRDIQHCAGCDVYDMRSGHLRGIVWVCIVYGLPRGLIRGVGCVECLHDVRIRDIYQCACCDVYDMRSGHLRGIIWVISV